jgi:hypothetical protein
MSSCELPAFHASDIDVARVAGNEHHNKPEIGTKPVGLKDRFCMKAFLKTPRVSACIDYSGGGAAESSTAIGFIVLQHSS